MVSLGGGAVRGEVVPDGYAFRGLPYAVCPDRRPAVAPPAASG